MHVGQDPRRHDGKIFGLGLSRTGTTSLHAAAVLLGFSAVHYPLCYRNLARHWLDGDFSPKHMAPFRCYSDLPTPTFFRELDRSHPGSKFVLTLRDPGSWADSVERQFARPLPPSPKNPLRYRIRALCYGNIGFDRSRFLDVYRRHEDAVRAHFAARPQALLVLDLARDPDAWQGLAGFLGVAAPARAFPHLRVPDLGNLSWVTESELAIKGARMQTLVEAA
jgi:hypothetical protein